LYVAFGALFLLLVKLTHPQENGKGLHTDMSLFYAIGWSLILEGVFSALYHVCPNATNFQFDTTFMLIGSSLLFICLYQRRHATLVSGPFRAYSFVVLFIFLTFLSLQEIIPALFWVIVLVIILYISVTGSIYIYLYKMYKYKLIFCVIWDRLRHRKRPSEPVRVIFLIICNVITLAFTITAMVYGIINNDTRSFSGYMLGTIIANFFAYLTYYVIMKYKKFERIPKRTWILLVANVAFWVSAFWFYNIWVSNKFQSWKDSKEHNKPCVLFGYFDDHDVWHFLSAGGLVTIVMLVYFLDAPLVDVSRHRIAVF